MDKLGVFHANQTSMCLDSQPSSKLFYWPFQGETSFVDHLCYFCLVLCFCARLYIDALWSPAGKEQTSWLSFVMYNCEFVTFSLVSFLIVSIPDRCSLSNFPQMVPKFNN